MNTINFTHTKAYKNLQEYFKKIKNVHLKDFFQHDSNRFKKFSILFEDTMLIDFSKNRIDDYVFKNLLDIAREMDIKSSIKSMFSGKRINRTENRSVLHIALRNITNSAIFVNDFNVMKDVNFVLQKMRSFSNKVITGKWKGYTGQSITDVVNIGIGGSDLGPGMVTQALKPYKNHLKMHYVSNIDGSHVSEVLKKVNPETTIFLIASKTFTTEETLTNANSIKIWFLNHAINQKNLEKHFFALTANVKNALHFGCIDKNIFQFWNWVGGRFSLWSAAGLSIMLSIGFDNFKSFLAGAHAMDNHFYTNDYRNNIPVILSLISIWYSIFFHAQTEAILPYDYYMRRFPSYLQQLNMESNGKSIDRNGKKILYPTSPIIWGDSGTNGQHAFYQLMHQGTQFIPCDFIVPAISHSTLHNHHLQLMANFLAQTQALAFGKSKEDFFREKNFSENNINKKLLIYKICEGNHPSNSIVIKQINPYNLGVLIALYEHKIFVQGLMLNIFSFDQWGVEIGKKISQNIYKCLKHSETNEHFDSSTEGLMNIYQFFMK